MLTLGAASLHGLSIGHCHPKIVKALVDQASRLTLSSRAFYNDIFGRYAQFITAYFKYDMVLPMNTGAEGVETAIKLARKWAYVKKGVPENEAIVLSFEGNFHGRTLGAISMSMDPQSREGFGPFVPGLGTVVGEGASDTVLRYNCIDDLRAKFARFASRIAAIIIEPIQGEAGIVVPDDGYLAQCYALCKEHNVLFIADEIQTGLGRTGTMLACDHDGVRPDVVILGKALSGGVYPVSAVLADRDVMLCIRPGEHGSTYGGNPLGCATSIAALTVLREEKLADRAKVLGEHFRQGLLNLKSPLISIGKCDATALLLRPLSRGARAHATATVQRVVRGRGLLNAIVIDDSMIPGKTAWHLCLLLKRYGLLTKPTHDNIIRLVGSHRLHLACACSEPY